MKDYKQLLDGDLDLTTGDLLVAESTYQHQRDLLYSDKAISGKSGSRCRGGKLHDG